jgi:hypothetical protein
LALPNSNAVPAMLAGFQRGGNPMRSSLLSGAVLSLGVTLGGAAMAQEPTDFVCRDMTMQVQTALQSSQSTNRDEAVRERNSGRQYCAHGYYKLGTEHLAQALKLLGSAKT